MNRRVGRDLARESAGGIPKVHAGEMQKTARAVICGVWGVGV